MHSYFVSNTSGLLSEFGVIFHAIGVREMNRECGAAFCLFGNAHKRIEQLALSKLKTVKPVSESSGSGFSHKEVAE